tara:strand:- start:947 stop:1393 length:447 start_codon:yes stop_codon:yes gene_type:complete
MMVVEMSRKNWKKAASTSLGISMVLALSIMIIGIGDIDIAQRIISGFLPGFIFSTLMMGLATIWFSFSRKQPWLPVIAALFPILFGLICAYFFYEILEIRDSNHENYISQGLADFLKMISTLLASLVAIIFSLVILQRDRSNHSTEEE